MTELFPSQIDTLKPERRANRRNKVFKGGTLYFNKGYGAIECVVRNMTDGGALLSMGDTIGVPAKFTLAIGGDAERQAEVRWRGPVSVGVMFP